MRITIEVPESAASSANGSSLPSVTTEPGATVSGAMSEGVSGGAALSSPGGDLVASAQNAESAGAAELPYGQIGSDDTGGGLNDGGGAPA